MKLSTLPEASIEVSSKGFIPATINPRSKLRGIGAARRRGLTLKGVRVAKLCRGVPNLGQTRSHVLTFSKKIYVVHAEKDTAIAFSKHLSRQLNTPTHAPVYGESVVI